MPVREITFQAIVAEDGTTNAKLSTDKSKTDTPTQYIDATSPKGLYMGRIKEIGYRINPANAVTYTLLIFESADAADYALNSRMLYESAAARLDDTDYRIECDIPFILDVAGRFYIATDWTAAAGNTTGYIRIAGVAYV